MLKALKLARFRGFKALEAEFRPVSVVLGPNSSGKTSVLHAIRMAADALAIALEEARPHLDDDGWITACWDHIVWDHDRLCPVADWEELFTDKATDEGDMLKIELAFDQADAIQELYVELARARNDQLKMRVRLRSESAREEVGELPKKSKRRAERLGELLRASAPQAIFVPPFYGAVREEEHRTWALVRRLIGGGDQSRIVRNLVARLSGEDIQRLNDLLRRAGVGGVVARTTAQDAEDVRHHRVMFRDTNGDLELSSAGAGLINLIALYAAMVRFRAGAPELQGRGGRLVIFLMDEPEAHLHPKLQGDIGLALAELASEFGAQMIIATHSVEMINRLGFRRDALLLAIDRAASAAIVLGSEGAILRELGQWCDLTPFASINFLASRRVLFHEGPSDEAILRRCAEIYFRNQPDKLARLRRWTFVSLDGVGNVRAQGVLRAVLDPRLFPSIDPRDPVRAVCVLDRDAERTPGWRAVKAPAKGPFEAHELVWSRYSIESLFIEPQCLAAWIASLLPAGAVPEGALRAMVEKGIAQANIAQELLDHAELQLMRAKLRATKGDDGTMKSTRPDDALKQARDEARRAPDVWQPGKDRARFVLQRVREELDSNALRNAVRTRLEDLVEAASVDKLGNTTLLVPEEIRALLDYMVSLPSLLPPGA